MCRWLAYSGSPVLLEDLLYRPANSLVTQSKHARLGVETTNGDGFGVGWYAAAATPGLFLSTEPAWNDRNLRELSAQITARRVFAHVPLLQRGPIPQPVPQHRCHDPAPAVPGQPDAAFPLGGHEARCVGTAGGSAWRVA
jgi:hypothetical protein